MSTARGVTGLNGSGARRVLMVLESVFPSPGSGGAEGQVLTLGRYFKGRGIDVVVVAPRVSAGPQSVEDTVEGVDVVRIAYPRLPRLGGLILAARLAWLLLAHRRRYAAIHAHIANTMAAVCCVVGRAIDRRVVVKLTGALEMNGGILAAQRRDPLMRIQRWALRGATYYHAISSRIAELLPRCGFDPRRVRHIPNAVDTTRYRPATDRGELRRLLGLEGKLVGVYTGRLTPEKALGFFLEGWAHAFRPSDAVLLLVVGEGELLESLRASARGLGIAHQILFLGSSLDVRPYLEAADFAVLPSSSEGLSNSLLEYMAAALPVIGSRVSGTEDLVVHRENGWLFESLDAKDLEACLRDLASTPRATLREMGLRGRQRVETVAAIPAVAEKLAELYGLPLDPTPPPASL